MAVLILDSSMTGSSLMGWSNALHTHFPEDPDAEYEMLERQVCPEVAQPQGFCTAAALLHALSTFMHTPKRAGFCPQLHGWHGCLSTPGKSGCGC